MGSVNAVVDLARDGEVAVLTIDNPPVNALSAAVRAGLEAGVRDALADPEITALVVICAGRTFVAGADITEFGKPPVPPALPEVLELIERAEKPVVAAIHGTALGGGLELAMACHRRIADPAARLGLPEVKLGLIPGGGGTQRLPRLVGVEAALEMITGGSPVTAARAHALGLVDAIADGDLRAAAVALARGTAAAPIPRVRDRPVPVVDASLFDAARAKLAKSRRGFLAPQAAVAAVEAATRLPFDAGLAEERRLFVELRDGPQSAAQRYIFFAEREAAKVPDVPPDTPTLAVETAAVVGAGLMGSGIAVCLADAGLPVLLAETTPEALERGLANVRKTYDRMAASGRITADEAERRLGRIRGVVGLKALAEADLIIEAVFEDMAVKQAVFADLDRVARPGAILATNTSFLDLDAIAAATSRPEAVVGLHFFSPANVMRLLEVVRGEATSRPVVATAMRLARTLGKVAILVGVCEGFVANRMQRARQLQANRLAVEGTPIADIDRVLQDFGLPMGPFAMIDMAGVDLGWFEGKPVETIRDMLCLMGRTGRKAGAGFYDYDADGKPAPSPAVAEAVAGFAAERGVSQRRAEDQEILERLVYVMVNEGAKILEEGIAQRASDIDLAWVHGFGWPAWRGGPMYYADRVGLAEVLTRLKVYAAADPAFAPAALIEKLVAEGRGFGDLSAEAARRTSA